MPGLANAFVDGMAKENCEKNIGFMTEMIGCGLEALIRFDSVERHGVRMEDLSGEFILVDKGRKIRVERRMGN